MREISGETFAVSCGEGNYGRAGKEADESSPLKGSKGESVNVSFSRVPCTPDELIGRPPESDVSRKKGAGYKTTTESSKLACCNNDALVLEPMKRREVVRERAGYHPGGGGSLGSY
ncbi:hypothetical protein Ancab_010392 [Ancistrocladus abbreviatus]